MTIADIRKILGRKYTPHFLFLLSRNRELGFNQIKRELGLNSKVVSAYLSILCIHKLIKRTDYNEVKGYHANIKYSLTCKGFQALGIINEIYEVFK